MVLGAVRCGALRALGTGEKTHTAPSLMFQRPILGKMLLKLGEIEYKGGLLLCVSLPSPQLGHCDSDGAGSSQCCCERPRALHLPY